MAALISSGSKIRGALFLVRSTSEAAIDLNPLCFVFQYNPEMLVHTFSSPNSPNFEELSKEKNVQSTKADKMVELISLNLELDAAEQFEDPNLYEVIVEYGLHPSLDILESILLSQNAKSAIVLFIWGRNRSIPVFVENVRILEESFDTKLNPLRVKIELVMRVLDLSEFRKGSMGHNLCLIHADRRNFFVKKHINENMFNVLFMTKIVPGHSWNDIVLPVDKKEQLRKVSKYAKNYSKTLEKLGAEKQSQEKGLNILFSGSSGAAKSLAAEIIANELKLDLFKIDLSMLVSKYIGETEKNLNRIFKEAEDSKVVLFFDEADALFGKRSEVKDSHDRYANTKVNYLLKKIEEHKGIVILASNLSTKIDDSFLKRMTFVVEFPTSNGD